MKMGISPPQDDLVMDNYNLTFDQLKNMIVKEIQNYFPNDIAHPVSIHIERVIVPNTWKKMRTITIENAAFAEATKVNIDFLMKENEQLTKESASACQQIDQLLIENQRFSYTNSNRKELETTIFEKIHSLGDIMRQLYEKIVTLHKVAVPLHAMKKWLKENVKVLKVTYAAIDVIQYWGTKYINTPLDLVIKTRKYVEVEGAEVKMHMYGNKQLNPYVSNTISTYSRLYHGCDYLVRLQKIPSVGGFAETKGKIVIRKEIK